MNPYKIALGVILIIAGLALIYPAAVKVFEGEWLGLILFVVMCILVCAGVVILFV